MPEQDPPWRSGPGHPGLAEGEVHVWLAELAEVSGELVRCVLSADERERERGILPQRPPPTWARSRTLLRELLGRLS